MTRSISLLLLLVAGLLAGCGTSVPPDDNASKVANWVFRRGGSVRVMGVPGMQTDSGGLPDGAFAIEAIDLNNLPTGQPPITDEELAILEGLKSIQSLGLYGSNLSDQGAETIAGLKSLRELELSQTQLTNAGLDKIATLPNLERVFLRNAGDAITDDGVKSFERSTGAQVFR